jgi:hypothetical protein
MIIYMKKMGVSAIIIPKSRVLYTTCGDMAQIYKRVEDLLHPCWIGVHINGVQFLAMSTLGKVTSSSKSM